MSAKKRKAVSPWASCDSCNITIAQKDSGIHQEKSCPPNLQNWVHPFVHNSTLYTTFDVFQMQDKNLDLIAKEDRNDIVLVPCHVLQLCKIPIGDFVLVRTNGCGKSAEVVKIAWPIQEKISDFSLSFSTEGLLQIFNKKHCYDCSYNLELIIFQQSLCSLQITVTELYDLDPKSQVIMSKVQENISPASSVTVFCASDVSVSVKRNLLTRLQRQNLNKVYCVGNKLLIRHYGSKVIYEIVDITTTKTETAGVKFCIMTPDTKWKLSNIGETNIQKSKNLIHKLGGLNTTIEELRDVVTLAFSKKKFLSGIQTTTGVLIYGSAGTGKTTLIEALAEEFTTSVVRVECTKIFSKFLGETEKELQNLFDKAKQMSPSVILIDDLDILCAKSNSVAEFEKRIIATLSSQMDELNRDANAAVVVLGTTSKIHLIDKMLRCPSRFGKEVEIHVPGSVQRFEILKILLSSINHSLIDSDIKNIADTLHGFVGADIVSLISKATLKNYKTSQGNEKISLEDFHWALNKVKPSAMKEVLIDVPNVRWSDIGGQEELKLKLRQCIEWPLKYKEAFTKLGITPPKGVLMFGPPGCSKTMIAKALATESQLNFISVKGPELFSKWVGESERAVRKVFRRARETAPSIIFFDELDAIGSERNISAGSNVQERVLAQLLTELDGVESLDNVTVIAATNRLDRIDPALLRPGRLDRIIYVPLPDRKTRHDIFRLQLSKTCISEDVVLDELVEKTEGYSGAEIIAVSREAALKALEENLNAECVKRKHFLDALNIVLPRTPKNLLELYDKHLKK